jgi:hypothetical protein
MGGLGGQGFILKRVRGGRSADESAGSRGGPPLWVFTALVARHDGSQKTGDSAVGKTDHPTAAKRLRQLVETTLIPVTGGHVDVGRHGHHGATAGACPNVEIWHIGGVLSSLLAWGDYCVYLSYRRGNLIP